MGARVQALSRNIEQRQLGWVGCLLHVETSWVCEENGKVVGFCVRQGDNITGLYVSREARGRGVGKSLFDMAKMGREWITVWAYEQNPRARKFYRREVCVGVSREIEKSSTDGHRTSMDEI